MPTPVLTMWTAAHFATPGALTRAVHRGARVTPHNFHHFADGYGSAVLKLERAGLPRPVADQLLEEAIQLRKLVRGYGANSDVVRRKLLLLAKKFERQRLRTPSAVEDTPSQPRTNGNSRTLNRPKTLALIEEIVSAVDHELVRTERILAGLRNRVNTLRSKKRTPTSEKLNIVVRFRNQFLQQKLDLAALRQDLRSFKELLSSPNGVVLYPTASRLLANDTLQALAERYPLAVKPLIAELRGFSNGQTDVNVEDRPWLGPALIEDGVAEVEITLPSEARGARHTPPALLGN